jgi:toxin ParE1/3/4
MPILTKRPKVRIDLAEIWDYIADDSETQADNFVYRIDKTFNSLAENSYMGRSRSELAEGLRSFPIGRYVIFYQVIPDGVEIVRVLHSARDIDPNFFAGEV